jgi:hypothetical protein
MDTAYCNAINDLPDFYAMGRPTKYNLSVVLWERSMIQVNPLFFDRVQE